MGADDNLWRTVREIPADSEQELKLRYGKQHKALAEGLYTDLGLMPYDIKINPSSRDLRGGARAGFYRPGQRKIVIADDVPDDWASVLAHEMAHVKDDIHGYRQPIPGRWDADERYYPENQRVQDEHHQHYKSFETEFGRQLRAQRLIESGVKPDRQILSQYPWLEQVTPNAGNRLANPWSYARQPAEPAWLYNLRDEP
jgi:hypothetical protein